MSELLYIIDLYSLVFQVFHAIPEMTGPNGLPTNAVFGFTRDLLNILQQKKPTHLLCATDAPGPAERDKIFTDYKANRSEMPEELVPQVPAIVDTVKAFGIPLLAMPGWEADDLIATVVEQAGTRDVDVAIVTNDKDARQLLGPRVKIYHVRKNQYLDEAGLLADWGIRPDQVIDFQSLVGDSVDNVPGVPLIGPKKATALLQQFGTLDEVLAHADEAPGAKLRENLKTFADQARMSRDLVTLRRDLPLTVDWDAARIGQWNAPRLQELFRQFGFRKFGDEVRALAGGSSDSSEPAATSLLPLATGGRRGAQGDLFAASETAAEPVEPVGSELPAAPPPLSAPAQRGKRELRFTIVDTPAKLKEFVSQLRKQKRFCLDLETTDLNELLADIVGWAFSWAPHEGFYVAVRGPEGQAKLDPQKVVETLRPILENPEIEVCNQNIKYDLLVLRRAGINVRGVGIDSMIASFLLEAGARTHGLDELSRRYLNHEMISISALLGKGLFQKRMDEVDVPQVAEYAVEDAEVAWTLCGLLGDKLRQQGLWGLYWDLERPLIDVLVEMQRNGIRVDAALLQAQSKEVEERLAVIKKEIYESAGKEFNIDSPKQLQKILFEELKLPVLKKTKTGASTDQEVLEQLALQHPLPAKILEHRGLSKLKSTYLDALPAEMNPETGKIHSSFSQVSAATGRLASSDPNLQNIPIRTEEGRRVRQAFIPSVRDWQLLCADYSQIELRMLAHYSGDRELQAAFQAGTDIHTAVAAEVYGVAPETVDAEMRRVAKAVNFGVIYGQSPFGLAAMLGIPQGEAAKFIENYFDRYSGVDRFLEELLQECARTGYAKTILGRRRTITGIRPQPQPGRQRNLPERTAINTVIQGSAADLIKQAMINLHRRMQQDKHPGKILLQIHDELVLEAPVERIKDLARLVREEMETALKLDVPLKVDLSVGENWLETETLEA